MQKKVHSLLNYKSCLNKINLHIITLVILMRKIFTVMCFIFFLQNICYANDQTINNSTKIDNFENDIILALLWSRIEDAVNTYYSEYVDGGVTIVPFHGTRIIAINHNNPNNCVYKFSITVEVTPYIGPHISLGRDHVTIWIDYFYNPVVSNFKHVESYEITHPYYKDEIIKPLP